MKILSVSPNQSLQEQLYQELLRHQFIVERAADGEEAWGLLQAFVYDLLLLEAALPQLDGLDLCRRLRKVGNPVLILLIVDPRDPESCVRGLNGGADACLNQPVRESELSAQIHALTRRGGHRASSRLTWGPLSLNPAARQISCSGQILKFNRKEYQLLELFLSRPRQVFSYGEICDRLWTLDEELPTDATIKTHICSIRRKLERVGVRDLIQTHYKQGYGLNTAYDPTSKPADPVSPTPEPMMDSMTANLWRELMAANALLHQEIEQRKQVENRLRRSEMMLRNAQEVGKIGCWEFDIQTRETYWTEALYLIHGLDPNQPPPTPETLLILIHPDDRQLFERAIRTPALSREPFEINLRIIRADNGEIRYINARGGPICDRSGKPIKLTGTTFDVTRWVIDTGFRDRLG